MANMVNHKLVFTDGMKAVNLDAYPPESWTWYSGGPEDSDLTFRNFVPWIARAERLRIGPLANLPFAIYNKRGDEVDNSNDYQNVLEFLPNPARFFARIEGALLDYGRAYFLKNRNAAKYTKGLKYFLPTSVSPEIDAVRGLTEFKRQSGAGSITYKPDDLLYFWPDDSAVELGPPQSWPLKSSLAAAGVLLNVDNFSAQYFKRGAIKAMILSVSGNPVQSEREKLKNWWADMVAGVRNAFAANVFNGDVVKPTVIGEGLEGLTDTNLVREQKEAIAAGYGIPFAVVFSDAANYATAQSDWRGYYETTILPEAQFIQETINGQLLEALGFNLAFQPEGLDVFKTDESERAGSLASLTSDKLPLLMAMDILGYELTKEQRAELEKLQADKQERAEAMPAQMQPAVSADVETPPQAESEDDTDESQEATVKAIWVDDLERWKRKSLNAIKRGKAAAVDFESVSIPPEFRDQITAGLAGAVTADDVRSVFGAITETAIPEFTDPLVALVNELKRANDLLERNGDA